MRAKIQAYVDKWLTQGYPDGIPDEAPSRLEDLNKVPSYRLICKAIIKNDYALQTLGYSRQPCELYNILKRKELLARGDESLIRRK
jgi:predicted phosphoadenosine phosphosulfate sulfurtransferase